MGNNVYFSIFLYHEPITLNKAAKEDPGDCRGGECKAREKAGLAGGTHQRFRGVGGIRMRGRWAEGVKRLKKLKELNIRGGKE